MKRLGWSCLLLAVAALASPPALADEFRNARISDVRGSLSVRGPDDDDVSYVERNAVIRHGDVLWTDDDGRAEIELERGAWVRMAEDTKLEVRALPPSAEFRIWTGSVYLDLSDRVLGQTVLKTPVGDLELEPNSVARVDLDGAEGARFSLYNGGGRVRTDSGAPIRLGAGERLYLDAGRGASEPQRFNRDDLDGFDRYQRDRVDYYINRPLSRELSEDIVGARDLNDHGSWVVVESTRYWRPRCEPDWRPYSSGYWSYIPGCGYTWIDYSPWGYTTSHYGRWSYLPVHGWLWSPGYRWAPSYVYWSTYGDYCGWAPLDPWDRPCYYGNSGFSLGIAFGNVFIDARSWSFCRRDRFYYGRHHQRYYTTGGRSIFGGHEVNLRRDGFHAFRDAHREIGVPRNTVRGLTLNDRGVLARDRVLRLEDRVPEGRRKLIESRYQVAANRDRDLVRRGGEVERYQRDPSAKIEAGRILRGDEAARSAVRREPRSDDRRDSVRNDTPTGRSSLLPGAGPSGGGSDRPGGRDRDGRSGDVARERGGAGAADRAGAEPGADRDRGFRRGLPGERRDNNPVSGNRRDGAPGAVDRDRPAGRGGTPNGAPAVGGDRPGGASSGTVDGSGRSGDRDARFRRGSGPRPNDPPGRVEGSRPSDPTPGRGAEPRRDPDQRDSQRREAEQRENQRRQAEQRDSQRRDAEQRDTQRRESEQRESQRRESERRDNERRESERRDSDRRESERRDSERRESERRDSSRRGSFVAPGGVGAGSTGADRPRSDDRFQRGGSYSSPSYRDYRAPSSRTPSSSGGSSVGTGSPGSERSPASDRYQRGGSYSTPSYRDYRAPSVPSAGAPSTSGGYSRPSHERGGSSPAGRSYSSPSSGAPSYSRPSSGGGSNPSGHSYSGGSSGSSRGGGGSSSGRGSGSDSGRAGSRR